jgi:predicted dienelactone hydrolase
VRAADIRDVLDAMLDPAAGAVPEGLRGRLDAARVGAFGHSMGSLTTGVVAALDLRVKAAAFIAQAPSLDIFESPAIASFRVPALYVLAEQDAVDAQITALYGTNMIRKAFAEQTPPAWLVALRDAGHWSIADDCALVAAFTDGCGNALDNAKAREIASRYVAAFFASQFLAQPATALNQADPATIVTVSQHAQLTTTPKK